MWEMQMLSGYLDLPETGSIAPGQQFVVHPEFGQELLDGGRAEFLRRVYPAL
jgi:hypothetical protein